MIKCLLPLASTATSVRLTPLASEAETAPPLIGVKRVRRIVSPHVCKEHYEAAAALANQDLKLHTSILGTPLLGAIIGDRARLAVT